MSKNEESQGASAPGDRSDVVVKPETYKKKRPGGGWVTTPFIFGCEASERLAGSGASMNLITFLTDQMHMNNLSAATLLNTFASLATVTGLLGAFAADAYLGRFRTIALGSWINLSGMVTLTIVALSHSLHPATCVKEQANVGSCTKASSLQMGILYLALTLMATGSGGLRPTVAPFGASQFDQSHPEEKKQLKHYFHWYYCAVTFASLLAGTLIVYIQDNVGWALGFGIPTMVFVLSILFFFGGMGLYRYNPPRGSAFTRMAQVLVVSVRKRNLALPDDPSKLYLNTTNKQAVPGGSANLNGDGDGIETGELKQRTSSDTLDESWTIDHGSELTQIATSSAAEKFIAGEAADPETRLTEEKADAQKHVQGSNGNVLEKTGGYVDLRECTQHAKVREKTENAVAVGSHGDGGEEHEYDDHVLLRHSHQFRFLDKAAIEVAEDWKKVAGSDGQIMKVANPWKLCPVQHIEELKCLLRLAPMLATLISLHMATAQGSTYVIQQAKTMDRHLGKHFVVPSAGMATISIVTVLLWIPFFDKKVVPFLRRYTGEERGITFLQKIGLGTATQILVELVKVFVERKRRDAAMHYGLVNRPHETIPISAFWLVPQFVLGGLGESFLMVGHLEFFYFMLPEHMTSTGSALIMVAHAIGSSLSTVLLHITQLVTARPGYPGWLDNNINKAHLDYFYGLLTVWLVVNFLLFLLVARWYKRDTPLSNDACPIPRRLDYTERVRLRGMEFHLEIFHYIKNQ